MSKRDIDPVLPHILLQQLHVFLHRHIRRLRGRIKPLVTQFILDLKKDHVPAVRDEMRGDDLRDRRHVRGPGLRVARVVVSQGTVCACGYPEGEAARVRLRVDVWSGPDNHVHAEFFGQDHDLGEIVGAAFEVENAG